jgi:protein-L-isoaspartate O-methyltransferase
MLEGAEIRRDDRVLEVGAGFGYAAAVAAQLAKQVCTIERHASLVAQAVARFRKLGYSNIDLRQDDGMVGWPNDGQFDVILVAGGDSAFGTLFDRYANRRVVLLGEASHGTSEFYRARAAITRRLIERHGFSTVAVEADWPDAAAVDRYVRDLPHRTAEPPFQRFPS